jgi:hypothetical protein
MEINQFIPKSKMSEQLTAAWAFLSGENCVFVESNTMTPRQGEHEITVLLPILLPEGYSDRSIAVGLIIDEAEAIKVGSFMFDIPTDELTSEDVLDACKESCNVLAGCLAIFKGGEPPIELGIPQDISPDQFANLQRKSSMNLTFMSGTPNWRVVITCFDAEVLPILE